MGKGMRRRRRKNNRKKRERQEDVIPEEKINPRVKDILEKAVASVMGSKKAATTTQPSNDDRWSEEKAHSRYSGSYKNQVTTNQYSYGWISPEKASTMSASDLLLECSWAKWMERVDVARDCLFYAARKVEIDHYLQDMERYREYGSAKSG